MSHVEVRSLFLDQNEYIYAGTADREIYKSTQPNTIVKVEIEETPTSFQLYQNYPNPFNPQTVIDYQIPSNSHITLKLFGLLGQEIVTLVNEDKLPEQYEVIFDADQFKLPSGVYFYELKVGENRITKKMSLLR